MTVTIIDDDSRETMLRAALAGARGSAITVGIHGRETDRDDGDLTNAQVGAFHEFGTATIPARPWLGGTLDARPREVAAALDHAVVLILDGKATTASALGQAAQLIEGEVKQYIADGIKPPLGQQAIDERTRRLGSNKAANGGKITPLVLSGQLRASILGKVTKDRIGI